MRGNQENIYIMYMALWSAKWKQKYRHEEIESEYLKKRGNINWITLGFDQVSEAKIRPRMNLLSYIQNIDVKMNCQNHNSLHRRDLRGHLVQSISCIYRKKLGSGDQKWVKTLCYIDTLLQVFLIRADDRTHLGSLCFSPR